MIRATSTELLTAITTSLLEPEYIAKRCRIDCPDEDLNGYCIAAEQALMRKYSVCFRELEFRSLFEVCGSRSRLAIPMLPLVSVDNIDGASNHKLIKDWRSQSFIQVDSPSGVDIEVEFKSGYVNLPEDLEAALLLMISHLYERYSASTDVSTYEIPMGVSYLMGNHKPLVFY